MGLKSTQVPESQLEEAVLSGRVSMPEGVQVPVVSPDGQAGMVPSEQLKDALGSGYKYETSRRRSVREFVKENDNVSGKIKVALGQFADEALFGIPETVAKYTNPLETEKWEALKEKHQLWNTAGGLAGFGAGLFVGSPVFKTASKAGEIASKVVASRLKELGVERGSQSLAKQIVARTAENATKYGIEGAVIAAPRAVTEASLGDPEAAAESLLAGAGFGAVFGLASGTVSPIFNKLKKVGADAVKRQSFVPIAQSADGAVLDQDSLLDALSRRKSNSKEIEAAFERFGLKAPEGAISDNRLIQNLDSSLRKSPTPVGVTRQEMYQRLADVTDGKLRQAFYQEAMPATALEAGDAVRVILKNGIQSRYKPFDEAYKLLKQTTDGISLPDDQRRKLFDRFYNLADENKGFEGVIRRYADDFIAEDKATKFESVIKRLRDDKSAAYKAGRFEEYAVLKDVQALANDFLEDQVERAAVELSKSGVKEAKDLAQEFLKQRQMVRQDYAGFKDFMQTLGDVSKIRTRGIRQFIDELDDTIALSSEKLIQRLFDPKNSRALEFVQKQFPEAFEIIVGQKRNEFVVKHLRDGQLQLGQFINEFDKLSPQIKKLMLADDALKDFDAAKTIVRSLPKDINPSGTAQALQFQINPIVDLLNAGMQTGMDKLKLEFMQRAVNREGLFVADEAIQRVRKELSGIDRVMDDLRQGKRSQASPASTGLRALDALTGQAEKSEDRLQRAKKFREKVASIFANPTLFAQIQTDATQGLDLGGAPTVALQFGTKIQNTLNYVQSAMPKAKSPPSAFFQDNSDNVPDSELASFERKMSVVENPFVVMQALKDGSLTREHVEALRTVYPLIYQALQGRIFNYLTEKKPDIRYQDRLKLSLLMGQPLDQTIEPSAIASYQSAWSGVNVDQGQDRSENIPVTSQISVPESYRTPTDRQLAR